MKISNELKEKIEECLKAYDSDFKEKLLSVDVEVITQLGHISQQNIEPLTVVQACENNTIDNLYKYSKNLLEMQKLYIELCNEYYNRNVDEEPKIMK